MQDSSDSLYRSPSSSPTKARRMRRVSLEPTPVYKNLSKKWKIRNPSEEYLLKRRYSEPNPVPTLGKSYDPFTNKETKITNAIELSLI